METVSLIVQNGQGYQSRRIQREAVRSLTGARDRKRHATYFTV